MTSTIDTRLRGGMPTAVARRQFRLLFAVRSEQAPADWCVENVRFSEAGNHGPFVLTGREYMREVLDDFGNAAVTDEVLVFGSQTGKTSLLMAGAAWCVQHSPGGVLWVMPSITLAKRFSRQRFSRMLRAIPALGPLVPRGVDRHSFSNLEMIIGGSVFNFVGSNSPANLSSTPCRRAILDEVDKFDEGGRSEADAVSLAEQRTKDCALPQRWKTSTPTIPDGLIWTEFTKGDQRRYFVPCPGCGAELVLAWSKDHTTFELTGAEAFVEWAPEARLADHQWDLDLVSATAHVVCPHCKRRIENHEKTGMVARGRWRATATGAVTGFVSRHLPSLYGTSPEITWGKLAVKFLQARATVFGLQGFINGDLGEPFLNREQISALSASVRPRVTLEGEWVALLTVDVQRKSPHFWYVVRKWQAGNSVGVDTGSLETWEDVRAKQIEHGIPDSLVWVDSGDQAPEVYRQCIAHHDILKGFQTVHGAVVPLCWRPMKGDEGYREFRKDEARGKAPSPVRDEYPDPYSGEDRQGQYRVELLTFRSDYFKSVLDALRSGRLGVTWTVEEPAATPEYRRHMVSEQLVAVAHSRTGRVSMRWMKAGGPKSPNHLWDCEVMQTAAVWSLGLFRSESGKP